MLCDPRFGGLKASCETLKGILSDVPLFVMPIGNFDLFFVLIYIFIVFKLPESFDIVQYEV